ncbi:MAG: tetratricopeptide repeat protein [Planctomycetales bacterium]|nr:tetratricopeptide repeat protein [Planctomycetales bacterium]
MSRTADARDTDPENDWSQNRDQLFQMLMDGRSFSGHERNCAFLNTGNGNFATVSAVSGVDFPDDGRCIAVTDWDRDGDADYWTSNRNGPRIRLMRNDLQRSGNFLQLSLNGNGTDTNRDAIGARVVVHCSGQKPISKTVRAGDGFLSQSSKVLHFGVGDASIIDRVAVSWPNANRETQTFENVVANRRYTINQSQQELIDDETDSPAALATMPSEPQQTLKPTDVARVSMLHRFKMPTIAYRDATGQRKTEDFSDGSPVLVNLFASWCEACKSELTEISQAAESMKAANIRVLALSVDQAAASTDSNSERLDLLSVVSYPSHWQSGSIDEAEASRLQSFHDQFFFLKKPLPIPASFLIDRDGRLSVIYRGPALSTQIIADAKHELESPQQAMMASGCFPGSALDEPRIQSVTLWGQKQTGYRLANWLEQNNRLDDAIEHFGDLAELDSLWALPHRHLAKLYLRKKNVQHARKHAQLCVQLDPNDGSIHNTIGLLHVQTRNHAEAIQSFRRAIELDPEFAEAHNNMGTSLASTGQIDQAGSAFRKAIEIDSNFAEAYTNLGSVFAARNELTQAIASYEKAVQIDPNMADALNNLGTMYARQADYRSAIKYYDRALKLDPKNADTIRNLERAKMLLNGNDR